MDHNYHCYAVTKKNCMTHIKFNKHLLIRVLRQTPAWSVMEINVKKERQCTCNVSLRGLHETSVAVKSSKYLCVCARARARGWRNIYVCVCECGSNSVSVYLCACWLTYPVCHAQAPYCLRPLRLHHIFRHYIKKRHDFRKKVTGHKICVLIFSTTWIEIFFILRWNQRDIINVKTSSCKVPVIFLGF